MNTAMYSMTSKSHSKYYKYKSIIRKKVLLTQIMAPVSDVPSKNLETTDLIFN